MAKPKEYAYLIIFDIVEITMSRVMEYQISYVFTDEYKALNCQSKILGRNKPHKYEVTLNTFCRIESNPIKY